MLIGLWDFRKTGIWILLPSFVFVAILLPAACAPGLPAEAYALLVELVLVCGLTFSIHQRICNSYRFEIAPRSPPER